MRKCLMCMKRAVEHYGICISCKLINENMKKIEGDLTGYHAVVSGGRIRIGQATVLKLLRSGANVTAITRFPYDAYKRYAEEIDYEEFRDRLYIVGFDLMRVDKIPYLIEQLKTIHPHGIDILVNNAAQTIRKDTGYYFQLSEQERLALPKFEYLENEEWGINICPLKEQELSQLKPLPQNYKMESGTFNSWVAMPEEISPQEMVEVQLINVTAPFLLTTGLKDWMNKSKNINRFVINVSSVEGKFNDKSSKMSRHIHTNMAKASLNMMTHSIALDFEKKGIYVYTVDPGWVSNMFPMEYINQKEYKPYLTMEDAASRICHPIFANQFSTKIRDFGKFYKNYEIVDY